MLDQGSIFRFSSQVRSSAVNKRFIARLKIVCDLIRFLITNWIKRAILLESYLEFTPVWHFQKKEEEKEKKRADSKTL